MQYGLQFYLSGNRLNYLVKQLVKDTCFISFTFLIILLKKKENEKWWVENHFKLRIGIHQGFFEIIYGVIALKNHMHYFRAWQQGPIWLKKLIMELWIFKINQAWFILSWNLAKFYKFQEKDIKIFRQCWP